MKPLALLGLKVLAIAALIGAGIMSWNHHWSQVDQGGYDRAVAERKASDAAKLLTATKDAATGTQALTDGRDADATVRIQRKQDYEKGFADARARAAAGNSGMRYPAGTVCVPQNAAPESAGSAARPPTPEEPRLLPTTATSILDAAGNSARDVSDYNAVVAEFYRCRAAANAE